MGAVTYPDRQVAELLNAHFVPVQVDIQKAAKLTDRYQALWTPNLNVIDGRGRLVYRGVGWLPPSECAAMLQIARGHVKVNHKRFQDAEPLFKAVADASPRSVFAPEALYFKGVCRYMTTHEPEDLKSDWIELQRFYPGSAWAMKANV